jgi:hypothetical protein
MHDALHKTALALLAACGAATVIAGTAVAGSDLPLVWHRQFMVTLLGLALVLAAWLPALRLPAIAAGLLVKSGALAIALASGTTLGLAYGMEALGVAALAVTGAIFLHESRTEARWDGVLGWRPEV